MYSQANASLRRPHDARMSDLFSAWSDADDVLFSFSNASSTSSLIPYDFVKPEPADTFIQDQLSSSSSSSSSSSFLSSSSFSYSPDRTSPAVVPLRASLVPGEMRAMMSVFRLNPFLYSGSDSSAAPAAPTYPEPGPLEGESILFEWWLDGAQRDDAEGEGAAQLKDEQDLDALLSIQDENRRLEDAQSRMEDSRDRAELPSCLHVSEEEPSQTASIDPVSQEALVSSSPDPCSQEVRSCTFFLEGTYEHSKATLVANDRYELDTRFLAGQAFYGISGGDSDHPTMVSSTLGPSSTISLAHSMENYGPEAPQQPTDGTHLRATSTNDMALAMSEKHAHTMTLRQQQLEHHQNHHQIGLSESADTLASSSPSNAHGMSAPSSQQQQSAYTPATGSVSPTSTSSSLSSSPTTSFLSSPRPMKAGIKRSRDGTQRVHSYPFTSDGQYHQEPRNSHPIKDTISYTRLTSHEHASGTVVEGQGFYPGVSPSSSSYPYHHHGYNCPTASASVNGSVVAAAVTAAAAASRQHNSNGNGSSVGPVRRLKPRYHHRRPPPSSLAMHSQDFAAGMTNVNTGNENSTYHLVPTPAEIYVASLHGENRRSRNAEANVDEHQYPVTSSYYTTPSSSSSPLSTTITSFSSSNDNNNTNSTSFIAVDSANNTSNSMYCTSQTSSPILAAMSFSPSSPCSPSPSPSCYSRPGSSSAATTTASLYYPPVVPSHSPSLSLATQCIVSSVISPTTAVAAQQEQEQQQTTMGQSYMYDATVSSSSSLAVAMAPVSTPPSPPPAQFYTQHDHHNYQHHQYHHQAAFGLGISVGGGFEIS